ncbi:trypsin-like peptidase domain-containing protein [Kitasatospora sp. NPDC097643]|uniref:trypsin-like peptidase domain-containing protein n=1 Tax=Kitasatospora sp. NPDC097643 TaxID=3157230 RepID=UPI003319B3B0
MDALAIGRLLPDGAPAGWSGTGFLVSAEYALTARHVLCPPGPVGSVRADPVPSGQLRFADGSSTSFALEDHDEQLDVALLRVAPPPPLS